jgi:hypothetical protein
MSSVNIGGRPAVFKKQGKSGVRILMLMSPNNPDAEVSVGEKSNLEAFRQTELGWQPHHKPDNVEHGGMSWWDNDFDKVVRRRASFGMRKAYK